ncbi:Right handed beta helix region [Mesorhizobium australicum]|uniref:Right handed beta helix region n=2 Tax=Mesorhizobium australicum TaxID=536018 RepID=A0A1X7PI16_9HYPH|nr:Right handed beta helix region [Mesorhizobium australicum]
MRMFAYIRNAVGLGILVGVIYASPAAAEITECTNITSVPATISTQGVYCMKQHLPTNLASGAGITVTVNNVTIDCNNFKLGNLAAGASNTAVGISATGRNNVIVRNCGIRGWRTGVQLSDGAYRVESNVLDFNRQTGIFVSGDGSSVRNNEVISTGGSTIPALTDFHGINVSGDVDINGNLVDGVTATATTNGNAYGIRTENSSASTVGSNIVRNLAKAGSGARRGIWNQNGAHNTIFGNTIVMDGNLIAGEAGLRCGDGLILNGASRDNTILGTGLLGTALGLLNCTSVSGDYVNPL